MKLKKVKEFGKTDVQHSRWCFNGIRIFFVNESRNGNWATVEKQE